MYIHTYILTYKICIYIHTYILICMYIQPTHELTLLNLLTNSRYSHIYIDMHIYIYAYKYIGIFT